MKKVKIELTPYNALAIISFVREFINEDTRGDENFKAIQDAADEYQESILKNISMEQIEDAATENSVNKLIGKWPKKKI